MGDGIQIHERVKIELRTYADNYQKPYVKPFMLVVAQDTTHAEKIMQMIKSDKFFDRYKDRVITIHSAQRNEEKDETIERLLSVEDPDEPTEIVIHVNMLKEGWDVTNLYTIVPLRAASSRTLVEQSIGRGLRLPYGKRTDVSTVDRLTIVAHDRFDEIITEVKDKNSIIHRGIILGKDSDYQPKKLLKISPRLNTAITELSSDKKEEKVAAATMEAIEECERLSSSKKLQSPEVQQKIFEDVNERLKSEQGSGKIAVEEQQVKYIVYKATQAYLKNTIGIPQIVVKPKDLRNYMFEKFTLDTSDIGYLYPVAYEILIQHLRTTKHEQLQGHFTVFEGKTPENHIIDFLTDFNDISYEDHADILHDLARQTVVYLQSYLSNEEDILNVLQYHRRRLADWIHKQMQGHCRHGETEYETVIQRGFTYPKDVSVSCDPQGKMCNFHNNVEKPSMIRGMLFQGFGKCLYTMQKFDSDSERKFAVLLEDEKDVLKWLKPTRQHIKIYYTSESVYEPDFVVETESYKLLCEVKMKKDLNSDEVQGKAKAAVKWCERATGHELQQDGKPWRYVLIPHDEIKPSATLNGLISRFEKKF